MKKNQLLTPSELEKLVVQRKSAQAVKQIRTFYLAESGTWAVVSQSLDWLRRLGKNKEAMLLLGLKDMDLVPSSSSSVRGQKYLWATRLLSSLGANNLCLRMAGLVRPVSALDCRLLGAVYLSNFEFEKALDCYRRMNRFMPPFSDYNSCVGQIELADVYAGLGQYNKAMSRCRLALKFADQHEFLATLSVQAQGEYLAQIEDYRKSYELLAQVESKYKGREACTDQAFLHKWLGFVECKLGKVRRGRARLDKVTSQLLQSHYRPEVWLDVFRLKSLVGMLSSEEQARLYFYPGLAQRYRQRYLPPIGGFDFGTTRSLRGFLPVGEFRRGDRLFASTPLELQLLFLLRQTYPWGISRIRVCDVLWPNQIKAFDYLDSRLNQLLYRLKRVHGFAVECNNQMLNLSRRDSKRVGVSLGSSKPRLLTREKFDVLDVANEYQTSKRNARKIMDDWEKRYAGVAN